MTVVMEPAPRARVRSRLATPPARAAVLQARPPRRAPASPPLGAPAAPRDARPACG